MLDKENLSVSNHCQTNASAPSRRRIFLVDDHPMVRERLAEVINREPDLTVCGEAEDRHQAIAAVRRDVPDLVIVDLSLKCSDGLDLIRELREDWPELLMLVVSMHDESLHAERVLRAGARGYITKQQATRSILQAIRQVLAGSIYLNEAIAKDVLSRLTRPTKSIEVGGLSPADLLADREMQVFELTGRGLNTRQIADRLNVGVKTIETYRHRIREKLKVDDPAKLLQLAIAWSHRLDCRPDSSP